METANTQTTDGPAKQNLIWLHCLSPLHNGSGEGFGAIDRPIIREVHTGYPFIQSSGIKGAVSAEKRFQFYDDDDKQKSVTGADSEAWKSQRERFDAAFGRGSDDTNGNQGRAIFGDASVLFFPVRSLVGTFALVTCPLALQRFRRVANMADSKSTKKFASSAAQVFEKLPKGNDKPHAIPTDSGILEVQGSSFVLEQLVIEKHQDKNSRGVWTTFVSELCTVLFGNDAIATKMVIQRALLISDDHFDHLVRTATQIEANIQILPNGITKTGSLRYTEYLPAETILYSWIKIERALTPNHTIRAEDIEAELLDCLGMLHKPGTPQEAVIQLGGDESTGKGVVRILYTPCFEAPVEAKGYTSAEISK